MITAAQLARFQAVAAGAFDETFTQQRAARTFGPTRNVIETWATVTPALAGNLAQPTAGQLQNYGYLIGSLSAWMVRVAVGTDIREGDRLITGDGNTLLVQVVLAPQSYQTSLRVLATEVKGV
jgi:hypothetical protein